MAKKYITTAIDYPNAAPHLGHVLEKVLADVIARWWRLSGHDVRFQIGTDEHGIKIQQTAAKQGVSPVELVERNVPLFQELYAKLQISADVFIRTTDKQRHWPTVIALWKKLRDAGALEKRKYAGLYCSGCERFVTKKDLIDGKCPDHNIPPQEVTEENWFFLLSKETDWLKKLLQTSYRIEPSFRANETLSLLDQGLEDVSFSRPVTSLSWGIPVPDEKDQTMYVWCDALTNYISGINLLGANEVSSRAETRDDTADWWTDGEVTHVIGKDIARFHALIWPAMLKAAGIRTPDRLLIHGFVTSEGQKMSKSLGNVIDPQDVIAKYPVDALRFFLSAAIPVGNDGDFSWKRFGETYDAFLRNQLGNLLNRVLILLKREGGNLDIRTKPPFVEPNHAVANEAMQKSWEKYSQYFNELKIQNAIDQVAANIAIMNLWMQNQKPWELSGEKKIAELSLFIEGLRHNALMLLPFIPETAQKISKQIGVPYADDMLKKDFVITDAMKKWGGINDWKRIGEPAILFPKIES